mmetsp:Transcript_38187/g.68534  ORF Transcript_38187/g.68534 Transcript_38187/m.68534 type:complete len:149 (+) Transcript_38187:3-449(+)
MTRDLHSSWSHDSLDESPEEYCRRNGERQSNSISSSSRSGPGVRGQSYGGVSCISERSTLSNSVVDTSSRMMASFSGDTTGQESYGTIHSAKNISSQEPAVAMAPSISYAAVLTWEDTNEPVMSEHSIQEPQRVSVDSDAAQTLAKSF